MYQGPCPSIDIHAASCANLVAAPGEILLILLVGTGLVICEHPAGEIYLFMEYLLCLLGFNFVAAPGEMAVRTSFVCLFVCWGFNL